MPMIDPAIEAYAAEHTGPLPELYERLRQETRESTDLPQMQVGRLEGRLLKLVAQLMGAKRAVEVGTFTGYSALSIAEGLATDGTLITCDKNEETGAIAQRYFDEAPWGHKIERRIGDARETLQSVDGPFDLAFIDADKTSYAAYWELLVPKMRSGGLILVDNVLWSGTVLAPETDSAHAVRDFNEKVRNDDRVERVLLTVRDGIFAARVRA